MRAVFGLLLIMLGLAVAVVWMPEHNGERQLAVVTDIATQGAVRKGEPSDKSGRTFSPGTPLLSAAEQTGARPAQHIAGVARVVAPQFSREAATEPALQVATTSSIVTGTIAAPAGHGQGAFAANAVRTLATSAQPRPTAAPEMSRTDLVRSIQRELKRVGCYWGDIDGEWGAGSRRAISAFTERVNASLPLEQPDIVLLALVQGQSGTVCGRACPSGQTLADNNRCLPNAVVARNQRNQERRNGTSRDDAALVASASANAAGSASGEATWSTRVLRTPPSISSVGADTSGASGSSVAAGTGAAAAVAVIAATGLPGRMSVGGPSGGNGAYIAARSDLPPARGAVRGASGQPEVAEPAVRPANQAPVLRERGRRGSRSAVAGRYYYGPPVVVVYRAPRFQGQSYAAAPRRTGRSWTGSFFGSP